MQTEIYKGIRGKQFKNFIREIVSLGGLKEQYFPVLLDDIGMRMYEFAFTHSSVHSTQNYELLEFLGDTTLNKSVAWYLPQRFPQLSCAAGVKVLTRLKINLISKKSFATFAKTLDFWDYITVDMDTRNNKMNKTLEDVFEAFFGATELLLDTRIRHGIGYEICYSIVKKLLDETDLSLKYKDIFDAKTRIKEILDFFGDELGELNYITKKHDRVHYVELYCCQSNSKSKKTSIEELLFNKTLTDEDILKRLREQYKPSQIITSKNKKILIGKGKAYLKADAQQQASEEGITFLNKKGFVKPLTEDYQRFCS